jgi:hypothetical protein
MGGEGVPEAAEGSCYLLCRPRVEALALPELAPRALAEAVEMASASLFGGAGGGLGT